MRKIELAANFIDVHANDQSVFSLTCCEFQYEVAKRNITNDVVKFTSKKKVLLRSL